MCKFLKGMYKDICCWITAYVSYKIKNKRENWKMNWNIYGQVLQIQKKKYEWNTILSQTMHAHMFIIELTRRLVNILANHLKQNKYRAVIPTIRGERDKRIKNLRIPFRII